jgi:ectoine hydroxylase-related dioxygenase (phytanoyl-CoA dioxygenase family)
MTNPIDLETAIRFWTDELLRVGYCIIPELLQRGHIEALDRDVRQRFERTPFCQGDFYGETTKRFGRLLARSDHAAALVTHGLILGIVQKVLEPWCDTIQLNVTQAIAVHPGAPAQLPHRDQDMWQAPKGEVEYLVNVIWPLTPFTAENGATRVWPRSHGTKALAPDIESEPIPAVIPPGSALLFLGSALHGAGANITDEVRRGLVVGYSLGWLKPYENQWLAYPPPIARRFPPELAALAGYRQHRPNLGNYEGQCPSVLLGDYADEPLAAIDALRPDQQAMMDAYVQEQASAP